MSINLAIIPVLHELTKILMHMAFYRRFSQLFLVFIEMIVMIIMFYNIIIILLNKILITKKPGIYIPGLTVFILCFWQFITISYPFSRVVLLPQFRIDSQQSISGIQIFTTKGEEL